MIRLLHGDVLDRLRSLPDQSVQMCVTSPPYWSLRDYGIDGQIGLEQTPEEYVSKLVAVFGEVRRVLRNDGTLWLNLGDSYASGGKKITGRNDANRRGQWGTFSNGAYIENHTEGERTQFDADVGVKAKDLVGIPWRVAFALQADGWYLRQDIIWHKPNPMPESVKDRCTKAHEYIFLLSKSDRYFYNADSIRESYTEKRGGKVIGRAIHSYNKARGGDLSNIGGYPQTHKGRNKRSVWTLATRPYRSAHFATFPPELPRLCISAGSRPGDCVLDPFNGAGTTGLIASQLGRDYIGIDLNREYITMSQERIAVAMPLLTQICVSDA